MFRKRTPKQPRSTSLIDCVHEMFDCNDDFLDEECFNITLECLFGEIPCGSTEESVASDCKLKDDKRLVVKSNLPQCGAKINTDLTKSANASTSSKRPFQQKLYVYQSFDKADSSLFLPSRLAKHFNSGNMASVSRLIQLHLDPNCKIEVDCLQCNNMSPRSLIKWYTFSQERHADSIMCVRRTSVQNNLIHSVIYIKYTDSKALDAAVRKNIKDPALKRMLGFERQLTQKNLFKREDYTEEELRALTAIASAEGDKIVYLTQEMTLVTDEVTKKVVLFKTVSRVTSMTIAPPLLTDEEILNA